MYGLAFAYMELGDMEPAQKHFQIVQGMEAPEEPRGPARDGLRKIAARGYIKADLARPYRNTPFSNKGKQLIKLTEKDYVNNYEGDISMIDKWAEFLGQSKRYDWVRFEDVPLDCLNSV